MVGRGRSARLAVRAKIVLACAEPGVVYERLAAELGVTTMTVGAWRKRFAQARCDGLVDGRRSGRPKAELVLTEVERDQLERWVRRSSSTQVLALRSKIILACADGSSNLQVAATLGVRDQTVTKWRARFVEQLTVARDGGALSPDEDIEQLFFEIDAYLLYAHAAYAFRADRAVLQRAAVAVRHRLGVETATA